MKATPIQFLQQLAALHDAQDRAAVVGQSIAQHLRLNEDDMLSLVEVLQLEELITVYPARRMVKGPMVDMYAITPSGKIAVREAQFERIGSRPGEPLADTWARDVQVLREVARLLEFGHSIVDGGQLLDATGLDEADLERALRALDAGEYVTVTMAAGTRHWMVRGLTASARREIGLWPSPEIGVDRLFAALKNLAETAPDEPSRSKGKAALAQLGGLSRDTLASIIATVITGQLPQ